MASQEPGTLTISVGDIAAMSDAALAAFMESNRDPDGGFDLPVDGWDKLSKDERDRLAERLKTQGRGLAHSPTAHSRPLDLDQLDARLRKVSAGDTNTPSRSRPRIIDRSRSPTPLVDVLGSMRERETNAYNDLVKDGGRPLYSIGLLDDVSANPDEYQELLRPWQDEFAGTHTYFLWWRSCGSSDPWEVFQKQWWRWQMFRAWQRDNRDIKDDDDGGFPAYVEARKRYVKRYFTRGGAAEVLAKMEADPSTLQEGWEEKQEQRKWQRHYCHEHEITGTAFSDYVDAAKRRLARHGFTRPFQLNQDPKQQGKLETWIEYLYFEYWWLDQFTRTIERLQPDYDKEWQKLVDSGVLRPRETAEFLRSIESPMQRQAEENQARAAVQRSQEHAERVYAETQLDPRRLSIPKPERIRRIRLGTHELLTARSRLERLVKRSDLIGDFILSTIKFEGAKNDAARHRILLPWILEQIPLIEAELSQTEEAGLDRTKTTKRIKRRFGSDDDSPRQPSSKKRKVGPRSDNDTAVLTNEIQQKRVSFTVDNEEPPPRDEPRRSRAGEPPAGHSRRTPAARKAAPQGLRRSARIAARLTPAPMQQVQLIEAELNGSSVAETGSNAVRGTKRRFGRDDDDEATHDRIIKKQKRDTGQPGPTPGRKDGPSYQGAKLKRSRDDAADNGPPSKRFRRGGDDLGSHSETSDGADAGSAGDSQESGTAEVGRADGDESAVRTTERPHSKGSKPSSGHLQRRKSTRHAPQSSTTTQPLRRSARIAAHQEALQTVVTRSGAANSPPRLSRRRISQAKAPPLPTGLQD